MVDVVLNDKYFSEFAIFWLAAFIQQETLNLLRVGLLWGVTREFESCLASQDIEDNQLNVRLIFVANKTGCQP